MEQERLSNYDKQKKIMEDAGVIVCESNKQAVETSLAFIGHEFNKGESLLSL